MRAGVLIGLALAGVTGALPGAAAGVAGLAPGVAYYVERFEPAGVPWEPGETRNVEEVFQRHEYFELTLAAEGDRLRVQRYRRGTVEGPPVTYAVRTDGGLERRGPPPGPAALYREHCASCHGPQRLGVTGPALLPESLGRLGREAAATVIAHGRPATQMPPFGVALDEAAIAGLVAYLFRPPEHRPVWGEPQIRASRVVHRPGPGPERPRHRADPLNLFTVVEAGDHHVTVLDGDRLEPIHRFRSRFALHGGLKYSPDGRFVYLASRDGWVSRFDLHALELTAEIRVGINTRNIAVSADGRHVLAGNYLPHTLVRLDARDLALVEVIPVAGAGGASSRVSAVYQAAPRGSFVAALKDLPEIWEVRPGRDGASGSSVRRIALAAPLDDFFFDPAYRHLIGADRRAGRGQVLDLESGEVVASLDLPGMPHLGSGITWEHGGRRLMATPNLEEAAVTFIDTATWEVVKTLPTAGPGFFMRSHERSPYAWVDVFFGPSRDAMHVIDKRSLEIVKTLRPAPGQTSAHVEFTRDGAHALVSIWEEDGALVVYDARTLEEVKRIPMRKPSGKYNVWNKITRSEGTSH